MITKKAFGCTKNGEPVTAFTLSNGGGMSVTVLDYACVLQAIVVPDRDGSLRDVALGYDDIQGYQAGGCYYGALVGRYANRIAGARFTLDGKEYRLPANEGGNHLHGTYHTQLFAGEIQGDTLIFRRESPAGEEGYPGTLQLSISYSLTEDNRLVLDYQAVTDAPTVLNLTNHSYFNLAGQGRGDVLSTRLSLQAEQFTRADAQTLATGELLSVEGTPMDFRRAKALGQDIFAPHPMLQAARGYDLNYVLSRPGLEQPSAVAEDPDSGITLSLYTTQPGVQLYTGNFVDEDTAPCGKGGVVYPRYGGFCLETQHYPCSPNFAHFPSTVLRPGELYHQITVFQFGVNKREGL